MKANQKFRTDIQGLRALSVSLIIIYHIWPSLIPGGFIGVDVFFVISGFLISSHLLNEVSNTGTILLARFWARRIRRLLPASFFVLISSIFVTIFFLPESIWNQTFTEISASAMYIENFALIASATDYLAIDNAPTLVQHFWSLSVEEQFYIVWPLLILSLIAIANRNQKSSNKCFKPQGEMHIIKLGLLAVFLISLIYCIYATYFIGAQAYFSTVTRAWEFALGGLLVFFPETKGVFPVFFHRPITKSIASWFGFVLIMISGLSLSHDTDFPGYIALFPVIGAAIIIVSSSDNEQLSFGGVSRFYPVQFLGGISYSAYLWHWPFVVLSPLLLMSVSNPDLRGLVVIGVTIMIAWLSKKWVEEPILRIRLLVDRPSISFVAALFFLLLVLLVNNMLTSSHDNQSVSSNEPLVQFSSVKEIQGKLIDTLSSSDWPKIDQVPGQHAHVPEWIVDHCLHVNPLSKVSVDQCVYGNSQSEKVLVVIGDSWATHFLPAIRQAFGLGWRIQVLTMGSCPLADVAVHSWNEKSENIECKQHRINAIQWILHNKPDLIIASDSPISTASRLMSNAKGTEAVEEIRLGLLKTYQEIGRAGVELVHLESPPRINCFYGKTKKPTNCKSNSSTVFQRVISEAKIQVALSQNFKVIDTAFWFCSTELVCPNQIGRILVKADSGHLTGRFSKMVGEVLRREYYD